MRGHHKFYHWSIKCILASHWLIFFYVIIRARHFYQVHFKATKTAHCKKEIVLILKFYSCIPGKGLERLFYQIFIWHAPFYTVQRYLLGNFLVSFPHISITERFIYMFLLLGAIKFSEQKKNKISIIDYFSFNSHLPNLHIVLFLILKKSKYHSVIKLQGHP